MHRAHLVGLHSFNLPAHRALIAGESGDLGTGEMTGGDQRMGRAGLLGPSPLLNLCIPAPPVATPCSGYAGSDGDKPAQHGHTLP